VYLLLYPRGELRAALADKPAVEGLVFEALRGIDTARFMGEGRVYGGGLYKMEPKELANVGAAPIVRALQGYGHWLGTAVGRSLPLFGSGNEEQRGLLD